MQLFGKLNEIEQKFLRKLIHLYPKNCHSSKQTSSLKLILKNQTQYSKGF
jgi:hypothetical protein